MARLRHPRAVRVFEPSVTTRMFRIASHARKKSRVADHKIAAHGTDLHQIADRQLEALSTYLVGSEQSQPTSKRCTRSRLSPTVVIEVSIAALGLISIKV